MYPAQRRYMTLQHFFCFFLSLLSPITLSPSGCPPPSTLTDVGDAFSSILPFCLAFVFGAVFTEAEVCGEIESSTTEQSFPFPGEFSGDFVSDVTSAVSSVSSRKINLSRIIVAFCKISSASLQSSLPGMNGLSRLSKLKRKEKSL